MSIPGVIISGMRRSARADIAGVLAPRGPLAAALALCATSASADLAPGDVWADWQAYLGSFGLDVAATETRLGDTLILRDITLKQTLPNGAGSTAITIPEVTMAPDGDGTVGIAYPAEMPIRFERDGPEPFGMTMTYLTDAMVSSVSGDTARMVYDYSADAIGLVLSDFEVAGEAAEPGEVEFGMENMSGRTIMTLEGGRVADQAVTSGLVSYRVAMTGPEGGDFEVDGRYDALRMETVLTVPEGVDTSDMTAALGAGFKTDAVYAFGPGSRRFRLARNDTAASGSIESRGGTLSVAMGPDGLAYGAASAGLDAEVSVPRSMTPLSLSMGEASIDLAFPVAQAETPQDFGLNVLLGGVSLGDTAWALLDPQGILPRDPAQMVLDLDGKATVLADLMDPAAMMRREAGERPVRLDEVTLHRLLLDLAGARVTGEGVATFDPDGGGGLFGLRSMPVGTASFRMTGVNTLIDRLLALGVIDQRRAFVARMALSGATVAAGDEGEDVLTSDIEFTDSGGIVANGQRLR